MRKITRLEAKKSSPSDKEKGRSVCPCLEGHGRLLHSASAQVSYYSELIQKNPEWEYAGVYVDCGIADTLTYKRRVQENAHRL